MDTLILTTAGLGFTILVCLSALRALIEPWLRARQPHPVPQQAGKGDLLPHGILRMPTA